MRSFEQLAGFPASRSYQFRLAGKLYRPGRSCEEPLELAMEMWSYLEDARSLLPLRAKIRVIRNLECRAIFTHLVESTRDRRLRLIAIFLRGQCGGYLGTKLIAQFANDPDERTRAAVAKALQRMSGWSVLKKMSRDDPSERVRWLAAPRMRRDFSSRLSAFQAHLQPMQIVPTPGRLFLSPLFELQYPLRKKSTEFIRQILERIRHLVRGDSR